MTIIIKKEMGHSAVSAAKASSMHVRYGVKLHRCYAANLNRKVATKTSIKPFDAHVLSQEFRIIF